MSHLGARLCIHSAGERRSPAHEHAQRGPTTTRRASPPVLKVPTLVADAIRGKPAARALNEDPHPIFAPTALVHRQGVFTTPSGGPGMKD